MRPSLLPAPSRAFPTGWHDRLIKAAIHADDTIAFAHADAWLRANDIDIAPARDHRLLFEIATRFGPRLSGHAAYPRLVGLRRMLWTRSQMALREIIPALSAMADAGVRPLLIREAARLAETSDADTRIAGDIDILVHPSEIQTAFDSLLRRGWMPVQSVSPLYVREHLPSMRGVRLSKGELGDILLHNRPFAPGQGGIGDDADLRERARPASLGTLALWLPSAEDGLALAIADGGIAGQTRSDWLVDAAAILSRHGLDWQRFDTIVVSRRLQAPALFALAYLNAEAGLPVPAQVMTALSEAAMARPLSYLLASAEARPRDGAGIATKALQGVARLLRKRAAGQEMPRAPDRLLAVRSVAASDGNPSPPTVEQRIAIPPKLGAGPVHFHAVLRLAVPPVRRRIEFELNTATRHICRIRYRKWTRAAQPITLVIDGEIDIRPGETELILMSRPARLVRGDGGPARKARHDALPFSSIALELAREQAGQALPQSLRSEP